MTQAFDYTGKGRRPTAAQIISDWKLAGKPREFSVTYGETYARFEYAPFYGQNWHGDGNGCRGVQREKVLEKLNAMERWTA